MEINGIWWEVLLVPPTDPLLEMRDGMFALGVCDSQNRIIAINDELNDYYLRKVLCHEIVHAAMSSYGVLLSVAQEEIVADLIATYGREILCKTKRVFQKIS